MTKLTKEQVKFFIETMTDDMHNTTQHKIAETLLSKFGECESLQEKLLAYEQAAKNPVAWRVSSFSGLPTVTFYEDVKDSMIASEQNPVPLYAAPVLPKQPEHSRQHFESLCNQFWNWAELDEIDQDEEPRLEWNGSNYTHRVTAALWKMYQAASAQPVIPEQPQRISDDDLIAVPRSVLACAGYAYGKAGLKDSNAYAQLRSYFFAPAITAQLAIPEQNKFRDLSQPVDPQISEYEKIMLQPDNSPVIPDAYVLDELGRMTLNGVCEPRVSFGSGWNACRAEMLKAQQNEPQNIPKSIPAQPVSEPYKLKDAVVDIRNSGVEIDADKIKAERDALNSPVIPDGSAGTNCIWSTDSDGIWLGDCGVTWQFFDDGPDENGLKYCPSCGKKISVITAPAQESE